MKRIALLTLGIWLGLGLGTAQAQFWNPFKKAAPPLPPEQRLSQIIGVIKGDTDENKRFYAVQDLRDFDTKTFPEIVPLLAEVAQRDPSTSVRGEAVSALVRIRPVTPTAGQAIEYAASKDENWRNRMNAQAALVRYRLAGYSPTGVPTPPTTPPPPVNAGNKNLPPATGEPPLGPPPGVSAGQPGANAPIIYYDQNGKVIPAPKGFPTYGPVVGTPTSNPSKTVPAIPANAPAPFTKQAAPIPTPLPQGPTAIEPIFRNVSKPAPTAPPAAVEPPMGLPSIPGIEPVTPPILETPGPRGPSLDLPTRPINTPAPTIAPPSIAPPPVTGPSLNTTSATGQPAGRMEPSPRLTPGDAP